jgi:hypothetical protein
VPLDGLAESRRSVYRGSILVSSSFKKTRNKALQDLFPDLAQPA